MSLDPDELADVAEHFGVADEQVHRDHAISHLSAALSREVPESVIFFGGTALSRTHLSDLRLSEDVDLIAVGHRTDVARSIAVAFDSRPVRRELGRLAWRPELHTTNGSAHAVVTTATGHAIKVQLLAGHGYPSWPTEVVAIRQRYSDAAAASLRVLTRDAFAAAKLSAWTDRRASRDLYDLWAMVSEGMVTAGQTRIAVDQETAADIVARAWDVVRVR